MCACVSMFFFSVVVVVFYFFLYPIKVNLSVVYQHKSLRTQ